MIIGLFDIALSSLKVAQLGLDTTGNNVANVETPGYNRRSVLIAQLPHNKGSVVRQIKREHNPFVANSWQDAMGPMGYYNVKDQILNQLEGIFNELEDGGIKESLRDFWDAWDMVANDAADISVRSVLIQRSEDLVINIHSKKNQLSQIKSSIDSEIDGLLQDINSLTKRLAELNHEIRYGKASQRDINSLLDERDDILRQLSEYLGTSSIKERNGEVTVLLQGQAIVMEGQSFDLASEMDSNGNLKIIWNNEVDITSKILAAARGRLSAYVEMRDNIIPDYIDAIDTLAYNLADLVNTQHKNGYDLNGDAGEDLFSINLNNPAGSIELNINDPKKIAASSSPTTIPSDNKNALAILGIKDQSVSSLGGFTIDNFYNNLISDVGNKSYLNKKDLALQNRIVENAESYFDSVSGVNLDEEAANTLKFQYMYTASARLISVANEMVETIINMGA